MTETITDYHDPNPCYEILRGKVIRQRPHEAMAFLPSGLAGWIMRAENPVIGLEVASSKEKTLSHYKQNDCELVHILATIISHHQKEHSNDHTRAAF
jgi:hypothetical protein